MSMKHRTVIIIVCLAAAVAAGLWCTLPEGTVPRSQSPATPQQKVAAGTAAGSTGVPAAAVPAPGPTGKTPAPQQPASAPAPAANVQSPQPPTAIPKPAPEPPPTAPAPQVKIDPSVVRFTDASIPIEKRMAEVEQLGKSGAANAVQTLMKLGDTYTYLNYKAIEALGNVKSPEVAKYLEGKLGDADPKIVAYAMRSLTQVQGEEAIPAIAAAIAANRQRPDGFQDTVCAAGVKALGAIGSAKAIPALAEEFEKTVGKTLLHEYGSQVVAAIKAIGDASGAPALKDYLVRLEKEHAAMAGNPMGQRYFEGKIKETNEALNSLRN